MPNYNFPPFNLDFIKVEDPNVSIYGQNYNTMALVDSIRLSGLVLSQLSSGAIIKPYFLDGFYQLKWGIVCNTPGNYVFLPSWKHPNDYMPFEMVDRIDYSCSSEQIRNPRFPINRDNTGFNNNYHLFETFSFG